MLFQSDFASIFFSVVAAHLNGWLENENVIRCGAVCAFKCNLFSHSLEDKTANDFGVEAKRKIKESKWAGEIEREVEVESEHNQDHIITTVVLIRFILFQDMHAT